MNIKNLIRIRNFIRDHVDDDHFDMGEYREGDMGAHRCDTVGCVLGHATGCLTKKEFRALCEDRELMSIFNINFLVWSKKFLEIEDSREDDNGVWRFLFDAEWAYTNFSSRQDAIDRMNYVIQHGIAPEEWTFKENFC